MDLAVRTVLRIGVYELLVLDRIPDFAAVASAVDLIKHRGGRGQAAFVNAVLRRVARNGRALLPPAPAAGDIPGLALHHSHPLWWVERAVSRLGWNEACSLLEGDNQPAKPVLRPNLRRITALGLSQRLLTEGIVTEPGFFVQHALRVRAGSLSQSSCLEEGLAWVQDEAAQLVPLMFSSPVGPYVADVCAAPGSKTMQLSETLIAGGCVLAMDRNPVRLRKLVGLTRRLGIGDVVAVQADMSRRSLPLAANFNQVLVDAPCSGTGTLRRHPEIRWRLRPEDLMRLADKQRRLLARAASLVAPGGELVYSVCSLEPEEGEDVVHDFLAAHDEFCLCIPRNTQGMEPLLRDGGLRTSPARGELDGFFAARLVRQGTSR